MADCPHSANPTACLNERRRSMRLMPGDPRNWARNPCTNCRTGRQHEIDHHVAEPDPEEKPAYVYNQPCRKCGQMLKQSTTGLCKPCWWKENRKPPVITRCRICDEPISARTVTGRCQSCYSKARTQHGRERCKASGCINKSHRGGRCKRHALERLKESQQAFRRKAGKIYEYRRSFPKNRIVPGREAP